MSLPYPSPRLHNGLPMPSNTANIPYTIPAAIPSSPAMGWPDNAPDTSYLPQVFVTAFHLGQVSPLQSQMYNPVDGRPPLFPDPGWPLPAFTDTVRIFRTRRRLPHSNRRQAGGGGGPHTPTLIPGAGFGSTRFKCKYCTKDFKHESTKCRHEKEHWNDPYKCPESGCGQHFKRRDSMIRHLQLMHGRSPPPRGSHLQN